MEITATAVALKRIPHFVPFIEVGASRYRNIHVGLRAVILGNGPSLERWFGSDFDAVLIGCNRSWRWFPKARYFATVNARHYDDLYRGAFNPHTVFTRAILRRRYRGNKFCRYGGRVVFVEAEENSDPNALDCDLEKPVAQCFSGLFALQVAVFMGFSEIYLLGFDGHDGEGHVGDGNRSTGRRSPQMPFYFAAAELARMNSTKIVNCNKESAITCFEYGAPPIHQEVLI